MTNQEYVYLTGNMLAMYIFAHVLYFSGSGFKNLKAASALMSRKFPLLPNANTPFALLAMQYINPQTVSYAFSTSISCVCYTANDSMTKGRPEPVYEKLMGE